ncbi:TonB-dependent receptor [Dysgonomonas sp. 520]|uniref:SusC/RagA family TonB-linked outer membrane protein n=1 Tax=Dysgonomonas sp. 520 TaxID=2302931 RepID=UPI0013D33605|nr:TonB-dependent receptor [Dysgonomonas sp. 520]NDW09685.1 TonB-dependent receptor [Dysgonomonas sp. 520]
MNKKILKFLSESMNGYKKMFLVCTFSVFSVSSLVAETTEMATTDIMTQQQATVDISGSVVDNKGEAIIGATIVVKGNAKIGTITDFDGNFSLGNVPSNAVIVVSYIGFNTQEINVNGKTNFDIRLKENSQLLDEVVIGYGAVKRENLLGAVSNIKAQEIEDIPTVNLSTALEGKLAGVTIGQASGSPLASTSVRIRIPGTFNGTEFPLFVIDGVIYEDQSQFDLLDPSEIESISVLKDGQAAVYGVRSAGGVFVVKTKRGEKGKLKVNYAGSFGVSSAKSMPKMMSGYQHATTYNDYILSKYKYNKEAYLTQKDDRIYSDSELELIKSRDYNWLDEAWKTSMQTRHSLNLSGGSDRARYFVGGSYTWQDGNFKNLSVNQYSIRSNVEIDIKKNWKLNMGLSANGKSTSIPYNRGDKEPEKMSQTFATLLRTPRWMPWSINGLPVGQNTVAVNPIYLFNEAGSYKKGKSGNISATVGTTWDVPWVKGLSLNANANYNRSNGYGVTYDRKYELYTFKSDSGSSSIIGDNPVVDPDKTAEVTKGSYSSNSSWSESWQVNASANYARKFGEHDLKAMLVYEIAGNTGLNISGNIDGYSLAIESTDGFNMDGSSHPTYSSKPSTPGRRMSYIGRLNYGFMDKYLLEATFRYEASTKFAKKDRWGFFPSIGVGWRISEEPFFAKNVNPDVFDNLKMRFNWATLGNDYGSPLSWVTTYAASGTSSPYLGGSNILGTVVPNNQGLPYAGITWETTSAYNGGFDMRFLKKLTVSIDGFYRHTTDILQVRGNSLSYVTGVNKTSGASTSMPKENYGIQNSWGGEIEVGYSGDINKDMGYSVKGNFGWATSKVIRKYQNPELKGTWKDDEGRIGGGESGYVCTGILTQEDVDRILAENPNYTIFEKVPEAGMLNFKDVGGENYSNTPDGKISTDDERIISKYDTPPFHYGFSLGFKWKDLSVDGTFSGSFGNDVFYDKAVYAEGSGSRSGFKWIDEKTSQLAMWKNYWTPENTNAKYARLYNGHMDKRSTFWMKDGHTLRMTALNITYNMPASLCAKIGVPALRVYFSGTNLWTIINPYEYMEPNLSSWMDYPMMRTFNFGVNLTL